jgi:adenosylmethionine-8-amino-7-oxononanoate aminotransferase
LKHLFPLRINNSITNHKRIQKTTKYGFVIGGKELIDLTSNLSTTIIGYDRHDIIDHVATSLKTSLVCPTEIEMDTLDVELLGENIYNETGAYSIYSLSGSDSIETAIRCCEIYHNGTRKNIISFHGSYHGSNLLNLRLSNIDPATGNRNQPSVPGFIHLKNTNQYNSIKEFEYQTLKDLKQYFETGTISCIIQETSCWLANFITPSLDYWKKLKKLCNQYDVLLIIDDMAICGGKTGSLYGFEITPDIFCVGKAFSSGYFPLSVCGINKKVYNNIKTKNLNHSYTHSFHLPGIVAANYYHKILKEEKLLSRVPIIIENMKQVCNSLPLESYSNYGLMFSLKFKKQLETKMVDAVFQNFGLNKGIIMNEPMTDTIMWCGSLAADEEYYFKIKASLQNSLSVLY